MAERSESPSGARIQRALAEKAPLFALVMVGGRFAVYRARLLGVKEARVSDQTRLHEPQLVVIQA